MTETLLIRCPACGATNRVPQEKIALGLQPVCGRCKAPLPVPQGPVTVTDATFSAEVERSPLPVVLDMWAPWCGPCRMVAPELQKVAARQAGKVLVTKVNTDELDDVGQRFNIRSIPTLAVFAGGKEVARSAGARPAEEIEQFVANATRQPAGQR